MKHLAAILFFFFSHVFCAAAQFNGCPPPFVSTLKALCAAITGKTPDKDSVEAVIFSVAPGFNSTQLDCTEKPVDGFSPVTCTQYLPAANKENNPEKGIILKQYQKDHVNYYLAAFTLQCKYQIKKGNRVRYESMDTLRQVSYPALTAAFGRPAPFSSIQPLETKYYSYTYTNPYTHKTAWIKVTSWDVPTLAYNIIYSIQVMNKELDPGYGRPMLKASKTKINNHQNPSK